MEELIYISYGYTKSSRIYVDSAKGWELMPIDIIPLRWNFWSMDIVHFIY